MNEAGNIFHFIRPATVCKNGGSQSLWLSFCKWYLGNTRSLPVAIHSSWPSTVEAVNKADTAQHPVLWVSVRAEPWSTPPPPPAQNISPAGDLIGGNREHLLPKHPKVSTMLTRPAGDK